MSDTNGSNKGFAVAAMRLHERLGVSGTRQLRACLERLDHIETGAELTLSASDGWQSYQGPRGGKGWRRGDEIFYGDKPGGQGGPSGKEESPRDAPEQTSETDDALQLAKFYAGVLNILAAAQERTDAILDDANEELDGTGWIVVQQGGRFLVADQSREESDEEDAEEMTLALDGWTLAADHAVGHVWEGKSGRWFKKRDDGRVVPTKNPHAAKPLAGSAKGRSSERHAKGPADRAKLAERLAKHKGEGETQDSERRKGLSAARMLARHHGEASASRIEELAETLEDSLGKVKGDDLRAEQTRQKIRSKLRQLNHTHEGLHIHEEGQKRKKEEEGKIPHHPSIVKALGALGIELTPELLADPEALADAIHKAASQSKRKQKDKKPDERQGRRADGEGSRGDAGDASRTGGRVEKETGRPDAPGADKGGQTGGESAGDATSGSVPGGEVRERERRERVAADAKAVNGKLDRYEKLFRGRGEAQAADLMGKLRDHVEAIGPEAALASLGEYRGEGGEWEVGYTASQYWNESMGEFTKAYLGRHGIVPVSEMSKAGRIVAPGTDKYEGFTPTNQPAETPYNTKLDEAKDLPGLEATEDLAVVMGGKEGEATPNLTPEVFDKLDARYGKGQWIIKTYGDDAFAGQGIFFPQRAAKMAEDARATIWAAGQHLDRYGFKLARNPDTGEVFGLQHETGDTYQFGTEEFEKTIDGDARHWAEQAKAAAQNEKGLKMPNQGKQYMVQPAFPVVGVSEEERAQGKTIVKGEGRVHVVVRNGKAEVIPHSTWIKYERLPVVFENDETRAMAKAAQEAIDALPEKARAGQLYAPDVVKTKDGYKVVELNASVDQGGGSGYLQDNPFVIDAYVSHLTGREPGHVQFIRKLLTSRKAKKPLA